MHINELLTEMAQKNASDIHIKFGLPPVLRIGKELINTEHPPLKAKDIESFIGQLLTEKKADYFKEKKDLDFAYTVENVARFRVNVFYQRGIPGIVIRRVKSEFPSFKELYLPEILEKISDLHQGIVIVCGPARSGKSTTIASMINYINTTKRINIITIEDPIEFLHQDKMSVINQRELDIDTESYNIALKSALREDPDLIYIGELRDNESFTAALNASETGHVIYTTLHASSAAHAVERVLDYFKPEMKDQMRNQLASNIGAIISQQLLSRKDGSGLVPAVEVLVGTGIVQKLIKENKLNKLNAAIELGTGDGMQTFNQSLLKLVQSGVITQETALARSTTPEVLKLNLQGIYLDDAKRVLEA